MYPPQINHVIDSGRRAERSTREWRSGDDVPDSRSLVHMTHNISCSRGPNLGEHVGEEAMVSRRLNGHGSLGPFPEVLQISHPYRRTTVVPPRISG